MTADERDAVRARLREALFLAESRFNVACHPVPLPEAAENNARELEEADRALEEAEQAIRLARGLLAERRGT